MPSPPVDGSDSFYLHASTAGALLDASTVQLNAHSSFEGISGAAVTAARGVLFTGGFSNTCTDCDAEWSSSPSGTFVSTTLCFSASQMGVQGLAVDVNDGLIAGGWYTGRAFDCSWPYGDEQFGAPDNGGSDMFVENFGSGRLLTIGGTGNDRINDIGYGADYFLTLGGSFESSISVGGRTLSAGAQAAGFLAHYDKDFNFFWADAVTSTCATSITNVTTVGTDVVGVGTGCGAVGVSGGATLVDVGAGPTRFAVRLRHDGTALRAFPVAVPAATSVQIIPGPTGEVFVLEPTGVDVYDATGALQTRLALPDGLVLGGGSLGADGQLWLTGRFTKNLTWGQVTFAIAASWAEGSWLARTSPLSP